MATITVSNSNTNIDEGVVTGSTVNITGSNDMVTLDPGSINDAVAITGGNDTLAADGLSRSTITSANGSETVTANGAGDTITAGNGSNTISAKGGGDTVTVGDGNNMVTAGANAAVTIGNGTNVVEAGPNSTIVPGPHGDNGRDTVTAGPNSTITLGDGKDLVFVGASSAITVGNGTDTVHAGTSDNITIGQGADTILYDGLTPVFTVPVSLSMYEEQTREAGFPDSVPLPITLKPPALGNEVVNGFRPNQDEIQLDTADFANFATVIADASQVGSDTVITLDPSDTITLKGVTKSSLSSSNFTFFNGSANDAITITGVPSDEMLSAGTNNGGGTWTLTPAQLPGLRLNAGEPIGYPTPVTLTETITNTAGQGASASHTTSLVVNPVPPTVGDTVLAPQSGDPVTETRLQINSAVDDGDSGNDYINRIQLTGVPSGVTLSSPGNTVTPLGGGTFVISTTGNPAAFNPELDVFAPSDQSTNFNLGITAYSDEPNSPEVFSPTASQNIRIDYSTVMTNPDFLSSGQSIWSSGAAFSTNIEKFLGIDFPPGFTTNPANGYPNVPAFSTGANFLGTHFGVSFGLKAGFQADLSINGGTFNGSLPFNITLDDTYNITNDTLEISPSDTQGTGTFNTTGPSGAFNLALVLDAFFKAILGPLPNVTLGPFSTSDNIVSLNSNQPPKVFTLPDGIGNVTVGFPNVNVAGAGGGSTISGNNQAQVFKVSIDPIAVATDAIVGSDPLKGSTKQSINLGPLGSIPLYSLSYTILKGTVAPGLSLGQTFTLFDNGLAPVLKTANGTTEPLSFGTPTIIDNASMLDTSPGTINFNLGLTPQTQLENDTSLVGQLMLALKALGLHGSIAGIGGGFGPLTLYSNTFNLGSKSIYDQKFNVAFNPQNVNFNVS